MSAVDAYLDSHREEFEAELCELLRIASVSTDRKHAADVRAAADWMVGRFRQLGFATEQIETAGHPIVFAESPHIECAPTALVYGHYDVQPPDPLEEWISPPFEPTRRDGNLCARGATDDKGQMLTHVFSARAWIESEGRLPINLKYLIEGEEEIGSPGLEKFIPQNKDRLACDCVVISDTSQFGPGQPAITYGLRGIAYYELTLTGPKQDLHSGSFGGAVTNPANALVKMIAALRDDEGRVQIPGFYDDVVPLTDREREEFKRLGEDEAEFFASLGVQGGTGEAGFSALERRWARPSFDVNGLTSGYQGEGAKTVLPARASAKFSFRLVPDQDPNKIGAALATFLKARIPDGLIMRLTDYHGSPGVLVPLESPYMQAAASAIEHGFGRTVVYVREGGSIPIVTTFDRELGADALLLGWGLPDDNTHSPNEKLNLDDFHHGIKASARLWAELRG